MLDEFDDDLDPVNECVYCHGEFHQDDSIPPEFYSADCKTVYVKPDAGCICHTCMVEHLEFDAPTLTCQLKEGHTVPETMVARPLQVA